MAINARFFCENPECLFTWRGVVVEGDRTLHTNREDQACRKCHGRQISIRVFRPRPEEIPNQKEIHCS